MPPKPGALRAMRTYSASSPATLCWPGADVLSNEGFWRPAGPAGSSAHAARARTATANVVVRERVPRRRVVETLIMWPFRGREWVADVRLTYANMPRPARTSTQAYVNC